MGEGWKETVLLAHQQCRHQPRGATFAVGREKCRGRYYRLRGLGSSGGCGRQDGLRSSNPCLRHAKCIQRGKQRDTAGPRTSPFQPLREKRKCLAALSRFRASGNQWAAYRAPGAGLRTPPSTPPHFPRPRKKARAPSDPGWAWGSQDPGRGNSAVCWLRLETSPRGAPFRPPGIGGRPNPPRRGSQLRPRTEVVLIFRRRVLAKLRDQVLA